MNKIDYEVKLYELHQKLKSYEKLYEELKELRDNIIPLDFTESRPFIGHHVIQIYCEIDRIKDKIQKMK